MPISILLVDDSEVVRFLFTKALERDPDLRVVGTASNGIEAIAMAGNLKPDMILLDIEMPQMDGLTALPKILAVSRKSKVFIISGDARDSANAAITSLGLGASEFILKPGMAGALPPKEFNEEMRAKIKIIVGPKPATSLPPLPRPVTTTLPVAGQATSGLAGESSKKLAPVTALPAVRIAPMPLPPVATGAAIQLRRSATTEIHAIAIASSTGGPEALIRFFTDLRGRLTHVPMFITQHMPPHFTAVLGEHISRHGVCVCREAIDGEQVMPGVVYVAPGGKHMVVRGGLGAATIHLTNDAPVNSCRPSADPMFSSISHVYGRNTLAVVLTGIGNDGCNGAKTIAENGGSIIAQDQASSVVYGMPKAVAEAGLCEAVVPIGEMASAVIRRCGLRYA